MRKAEIELSIKRQLSPAKYGQLVKDLRGTVRAFDLLNDVAPSLLRDLIREQSRKVHGGALQATHAALEDLISELREHRTEIVRPIGHRAFTIIRGGKR